MFRLSGNPFAFSNGSCCNCVWVDCNLFSGSWICNCTGYILYSVYFAFVLSPHRGRIECCLVLIRPHFISNVKINEIENTQIKRKMHELKMAMKLTIWKKFLYEKAFLKYSMSKALMFLHRGKKNQHAKFRVIKYLHSTF